MTGTEIKTLTESILDESIEETMFLNLLNVAKNLVEDMRPWELLKSEDSTKVHSQGDNYLTAKTLPTNFKYDYAMIVGLDEFNQVPFTEKYAYKDSARKYYIDLAGNSFYLTGNGTGNTVHLFYIKNTDDIDLTTSWSFPTRFHPLLAFYIVGFIMGGQDADEIYRMMAPENKIQMTAIQNSMISWDDTLKLRAIGDSYADQMDSEVPLGQRG